MPHIFISTGEVSGDLQASYLIRSLRSQRSDLRVTALGGERVAAAGATLLHDTTAISSMGLLEALPFIVPTLRIMRRVRRWLQRDRPDVAILVDYVGVNARIGTLLQQQGIPVIYYIAPQEWVWHYGNAMTQRLVNFSRLMLSIFAEEERYYSAAGGNVRWVGHPLVDILQSAPSRKEARAQLGIAPETRAVMVMPASRAQELRAIVPVLVQAARQIQQQIPQVKVWIPLSQARFERALTRSARQAGLEVAFVRNNTRAAIAAADLILAKSGTVNLEAAILGIPQVVVYRVHWLTAWIARKCLNFSIPFMSPPNLVQMRAIVPELLQGEATPARVVAEALPLLVDRDRQRKLQQDYAQMRLALGKPGAIDRAAVEVLRILAEVEAKSGTSNT
ncbi:MAG: lipid-A-disaccharide synthase [Cyanobacteria bacterium P01_D01_bin.123]